MKSYAILFTGTTCNTSIPVLLSTSVLPLSVHPVPSPEGIPEIPSPAPDLPPVLSARHSPDPDCHTAPVGIPVCPGWPDRC